MDKTVIKSFAIESRRKLIESVKYQASLIGITSEGISEPISKAEGMETYDYGAGTYTLFDEDLMKRENLVKEVKNKSFDNVVEEVAYTWFNRIIAIRYMEVNDYLPTRTRVLSSELDGKIEPDIITESLDLDLDLTPADKDLILKFRDENKLDDLFRFLLIKQCNKLNEILPGLFEKTDDYTELLLNISFTDTNGIIRKLVDNVPETYFNEQVEIIGWLYQFYNTELKNETFENIKKNKVSKERIPAATQLFTPDWIVKYMVENSVGRIWLEKYPNNDLKSKWVFYVEDINQESDVKSSLVKIINDYKIFKPEDIKVIDPCMGSGHILVYVFDVLMQIYLSEGYMEREATELILKNNIYGLDIDKRAYQLAYFAVLMKAREFNRKILDKNIMPNLVSIEESNAISEELIYELIDNDKTIKEDLCYLYEKFKDAKEYGSILEVDKVNLERINDVIKNFNFNNSLYKFKYKNELNLLKNIIKQTNILSAHYDVVITNPPYMNSSGMNKNLNNYLKINFPDSKADLCTVFIEKCHQLSKQMGFVSMITQQSFMFLKTFEKLRIKLINDNTIINMVHLGPHAFDEIGGEVVQATSFISRNCFIDNYNSTFYRLIDFNSEKTKQEQFFNNANRFVFKQSNFKQIRGNPITYWVADDLINIFKNKQTIEEFSISPGQNKTGNNKKFLRYFWEVKSNYIDENYKWVYYAKGGSFRKWAGNIIHVSNWSPEALEHYKKDKICRLIAEEYRFIDNGITWGSIASGRPSFRVLPKNATYDSAGPSIFINDDKLYYYILGLLNTNVYYNVVNLVNPTLTIRVSDIRNMALIIDENSLDKVNLLVKDCCKLSEDDWNDYEISYNFVSHPFIRFKNYGSLKDIFYNWSVYKNNQINTLKSNEIELNKIFSDIYSVKLDNAVDDKYLAINNADYEKDVKSFISYAVGCMFGRYSLDNGGIVSAGEQFDLSNYSKFIPDDDNIIPVLDTEYFDDDIVGKFVEFVEICFGEERKEENLEFIAGALNKKGKTSREAIRNYLLTDFFKDHVKLYNKCPIYWMFNSGKQNAFNCLIYVHRYEPNLIARIRTDYLHKTQKAIEQNMSHCDNVISSSNNKSEISRATKDKSRYVKQLDEIKNYDEALRHMATQHIEIDLDDGVNNNYKKFQKVEISIEGEKPKKINLLKNI